jgi:hypothetical protein
VGSPAYYFRNVYGRDVYSSGIFYGTEVRAATVAVGLGASPPSAQLHAKIPDQATRPLLVEASDGSDLLRLDQFPTTDRAQLLVGAYNADNRPNYSFVSDTDTGISGGYSADTLQLITGGVLRATVDPNGHLILNTYGTWLYGKDSAAILRPLIRSRGMGYAEASYPGLQIGTTDSHIALFVDPATNPGSAFNGNVPELVIPNALYVVQANASGTNWLGHVASLLDGNVGIGTATPLRRLHVVGDATDPLLITKGSGTGGLLFSFDAVGGTPRYVSSIRTFESGTAGNNYMAISASAGVSTSQEVMRLIGNGNVGIGTASPNFPLHVAGTIYSGNIIQASTAVVCSVGQFLDLYPLNDSNLHIKTRPGVGNRDIVFSSTGTTPTETARLNSSGYFGLRTNNPLAPLHIEDAGMAATNLVYLVAAAAPYILTMRNNNANQTWSYYITSDKKLQLVDQTGSTSRDFLHVQPRSNRPIALDAQVKDSGLHVSQKLKD